VSQTSLAQTPGEVDLETFEERAAIINFDGGAPVEWAEALARLDRNKPPGGMTQRRWRQVLEDVGRFLDEWGNRAHERVGSVLARPTARANCNFRSPACVREIRLRSPSGED
jgi:hypothetical protein